MIGKENFMYTSIISATIDGLNANIVQVEIDVSSGLPGFSVIGNVNRQIREAPDRVKTALHNIQINLPPRRITVNLSPGDILKTGTGFELPIAAGILALLEDIPQKRLENVFLTGEIGLDGQIKGVRGILEMIRLAKEVGCTVCVVPKVNLEEAQMIEGILHIGVSNLEEFILMAKKEEWNEEKVHIKNVECQEKKIPNFGDVKSQNSAKRAALLAASGFHNLLLMGPPGSGKTMIAERIPGILPELTKEEALELVGIYSIAGVLPQGEPRILQRPFRSPHHTISPQALAGGGKMPVPGEITLAHRGVLFLDELPEMKRSTLEILRQPLEEHKIWISRVGGNYCFPSEFLLVAAMNPCPCGYYPNRNRCNCAQYQIERYLNQISQPLLDRIDLCAETISPSYEEFRNPQTDMVWTTASMREMAKRAHEMQTERFWGENFRFNGEIPVEKISRYCVTKPDAEKMLKSAFKNLELTGRACNRILKVARTIADLEGEEKIEEIHMAEAIAYRSIDKRYWK